MINIASYKQNDRAEKSDDGYRVIFDHDEKGELAKGVFAHAASHDGPVNVIIFVKLKDSVDREIVRLLALIL